MEPLRVFAVDDETMESVVLDACRARGWSLGVAESLTGGLVGARLAAVPGASATFRCSLASYATEVKRSVLGVGADSVVSEQAAVEMADGARTLLERETLADAELARVLSRVGPEEPRLAAAGAAAGT